jgi:hypothetical protein
MEISIPLPDGKTYKPNWSKLIKQRTLKDGKTINALFAYTNPNLKTIKRMFEIFGNHQLLDDLPQNTFTVAIRYGLLMAQLWQKATGIDTYLVTPRSQEYIINWNFNREDIRNTYSQLRNSNLIEAIPHDQKHATSIRSTYPYLDLVSPPSLIVQSLEHEKPRFSYEISLPDMTKISSARLAVLKVKNPQDEELEINRTPSHQLEEIDQLLTYDLYLKEQLITLELDSKINAASQLFLSALSQDLKPATEGRKTVYNLQTLLGYQRVWNNVQKLTEAFTEGGRIYASIQQIPSDLRQFIRINRQTTTELDYSAFHPFLLHAQEGLQMRHDPYAIYRGDNPETAARSRKGAKVAFQIMLNSETKEAAIAALKHRIALKAEGFIAFNNGKITAAEYETCKADELYISINSDHAYASAEQVYEEICNRNKDIAHHFGSGAGLRLQATDSRIAINVAYSLYELAIPCIAIHDSFMVPADRKDEARIVMENECLAIVGQRPTVKVK